MSIPPPPGPQQPQDDPYQPPQPQAPNPQFPHPHDPHDPHDPHGRPVTGEPPQGQQPHGQPPYPQGPLPYSPYPAASQVPYGAPPYAVWGQGYAPLNRPAPVNGVAIAALVLGVLCFLPAVGLILGIIALVQIKKRGERGKGMAIGGAVLSGLGLALWILLLATGGGSAFMEGVKEGAARDTSLSLVKGDCFDVPGASFDENVYDVDKVPCAGEHDAEVFGVVPLPGDDYPGDGSVSDQAKDECWTLQSAYAMDSWSLTEDVEVYHLTPTRESWEWGDREITCVFAHAGEKGALTGSLRTDETTLDPDQLAFLTAMATVDDVLLQEPDDLAEDDMTANRNWASNVGDMTSVQARELSGHPWPAEVEKPVTDLVTDLQKAAEEWAAAAEASDVDTFYEHYENAYAYVDGDATVTARKALGLTTARPSYGDGDSGGAGGGTGGSGLDV
ncbi:DUF4190 domain-containing protein [Streptomyces sp. NPDC102395]|uniref:DUF4190 domain-containing protein n=1 Tax=Streptomyces sp. NPDC102395 TaxID=3366168 RepID=UPI0037F93647